MDHGLDDPESLDHPEGIDDPDGAERDESPTERADRNWDELLQELRVTQTGIQILSGFLLTLPFQQRFTELDGFLRGTFLAAVTLATMSTALMVAPVAAHRMAFRKHRKIELVSMADRLARIGLTLLALTVACVVTLVFGFVTDRTVGILAGCLALAFFAVQWLLVPKLTLRDRPAGRT